MKYSKKSDIVVEVFQYQEYGKLVPGMCNSQSCFTSGNDKPHVHTIHNNQIVNLEVGDWIIPEVDGKHFYPCKDAVFRATYEPHDTHKHLMDVLREIKLTCLNCKTAQAGFGHIVRLCIDAGVKEHLDQLSKINFRENRVTNPGRSDYGPVV